MEVAIQKLKEAEVVLMRKIKRMKDGQPKYAAARELDEYREAIRILERVGMPIRPETPY
jgi:hypothetical protein